MRLRGEAHLISRVERAARPAMAAVMPSEVPAGATAPRDGQAGVARKTARSTCARGVYRPRVRWLITLLLALPLGATDTFHYDVVGDDPGSWPAILSSVSLFPGDEESAGVLVRRGKTGSTTDAWRRKVDDGSYLILEGASDIASEFGFRKTEETVPVRSVVDDHDPELEIVWETQQELPRYTVPTEARIFVRERWTGTASASSLS